MHGCEEEGLLYMYSMRGADRGKLAAAASCTWYPQGCGKGRNIPCLHSSQAQRAASAWLAVSSIGRSEVGLHTAGRCKGCVETSPVQVIVSCCHGTYQQSVGRLVMHLLLDVFSDAGLLEEFFSAQHT